MSRTEGYAIEFESPPHPGELLGEYLDAHSWSQSDLARRAGISAKTISEIRNGKAAISPASALALETVFGRPAHFWLGVQRVFDEAEARAKRNAEATAWRDWAKSFPLKRLRELGFIDDTGSDVDAVLRFLGVSSPDSWDSVWRAAAVAYRQTHPNTSPAVGAWVRATELSAQEVCDSLPVGPYSESRFQDLIPSLRSLTCKKIGSDSLLELQKLCATAGVVVVLVPELGPTGISGCARWLTRSRAVIALTLRFKSDDHLWFTFFHEVGHVILHRGRHQFVLDNAEHVSDLRGVDPELREAEEQANRFARNTLIPPSLLADFVRSHAVVSSEDVATFAAEIGIGPGIVVGRLQHDGVLDWHQGNAFKQKLDFSVR
jgi:addiction module HigA family antidote